MSKIATKDRIELKSLDDLDINGYEKLIADCERLMEEVNHHAAELPHAEDFQRDLEASAGILREAWFQSAPPARAGGRG